nr:hypothetical protein [Tanacetum cinerariifolium]
PSSIRAVAGVLPYALGLAAHRPGARPGAGPNSGQPLPDPDQSLHP